MPALDKQALRQALKDPRHAGITGQELGRYEILSKVGKGGAGLVFRARHKELGSLVALKLLMAEDKPDAVARFRREGRVLAQLKHPNVVGISDLGEENGIPFLAMELIEGDNLYKLVKGPGGELPSFEDAVEITLAVAQALHHCHEKGVVHRDVKPNNILIEHGTRRPVLSDFGLVKRDPTKLGAPGGTHTTGAVTMAGQLMGTPSFMAPEQFDPGGEFGEVGPKTDGWGLGATLFFLLTGGPPFQSKNVVDLYASVTTDPVPRARSVRSDVPEALDDLCAACLTKKVDERIGMNEVIERLERLQGGLARASSRRGIRHATFVLVFFVALCILDVAWLHPARGRRLLGLLLGRPSSTEPDGGATGGDGAADADGAATAEVSAEVAALRERARGGDTEAMVALGVAAFNGEGLPQDHAEALRWFAQAADSGDPKAMLWLGHMHEKGLAVEGGSDPEAALRWYRQAAERGDGDVARKARERTAELEGRLDAPR